MIVIIILHLIIARRIMRKRCEISAEIFAQLNVLSLTVFGHITQVYIFYRLSLILRIK